MEQTWELHKAAIRDLYLVQDLKTSEVIDRMEEEYGFKANAGQYERQFKKWGLRKNLKKHEWIWYIIRERKRKREGKESRLKVDGVLVPKKKIIKAEKTYELTTLEKITMALQHDHDSYYRSPTPPGLSVYTPLSFIVPFIDFSALPFNRFRNDFLSKVTPSPSSDRFKRCFEELAGPLLTTDDTEKKRQQISAACVPINEGQTIFDESISSTISSICNNFTLNINLTTNHLLPHPQSSWKTSLRSHIPDMPEQWSILQFLRSPKATPILKWLLRDRNPTSEALSYVLFKEALLSKDLNVVRTLIQHKNVDLNALLPGPWRMASTVYVTGPQYPVEVATKLEDPTMVQLLVQSGATKGITEPSDREGPRNTAKVDDAGLGSGFTTLFRAICDEDVRRLEELLKIGYDANGKDPNTGFPILFFAAKVHSSVEISTILLDHGADPNKAAVGIGSLHVAAAYEDLELARLLINRGADINLCCDSIETRQTEGARPMASYRIGPSCNLAESPDILSGLRNHRAPALDKFRSPTPLQIAASRNDLEMARFLVEQGADVNAAGANIHLRAAAPSDLEDLLDLDFPAFDGCTALAIALLQTKSSPMIDVLTSRSNGALESLKSQLDLGSEGRVLGALCRAIALRRQEALGFLFTSGFKCVFGPFVAAIQAGDMDVARYCIQAGLDVNALVGSGKSLLTYLLSRAEPSESRLIDACKLLMEHGADLNHRDARPTALEVAFERDKLEVAEFLVWNGARLNKPRTFYMAMNHFPISAIHLLSVQMSTDRNLEYSFRRTCFGHPVLYRMVWRREWTVVSDLLKNGINTRSPCAVEALRLTCVRRWGCTNERELRELLRAGVPPNPPEDTTSCQCWPSGIGSDKFSPLQAAIEYDNLGEAKALLEYKADPNFIGVRHVIKGSDTTPRLVNTSVLNIAVDKGNLAAIHLLLENGANVDLPAIGDFGRTALQGALERQVHNTALIERLLDAGADVNAPPAESEGVTALQAAAISGFIAPASKLIELGADVNAPRAGREGRTALEGAAEHGRLDMVGLLLDAGADLEAPQFGNAVEFARRNGYNAVANMLVRCRADQR